MNLQRSDFRPSRPSVAIIPAAQPYAIESTHEEHLASPTIEQRAEWSLGLSLQNWRLLPPEARMPDFVLRLAFMKSLPDAPIDIRVLLFAHTCKLATIFSDFNFQCAWRMLVDAYQQETPEVREMLKDDMNRVHAKCATHGNGGVPWELSSES